MKLNLKDKFDALEKLYYQLTSSLVISGNQKFLEANVAAGFILANLPEGLLTCVLSALLAVREKLLLMFCVYNDCFPLFHEVAPAERT